MIKVKVTPTWKEEINGLLDAGYTPYIYRDSKKRVVEVSFTRKYRDVPKVRLHTDGVSYLNDQFRYVTLKKIARLVQSYGGKE